MMKVPVLLAILSFFSSSLASPLQSWDDICEATPPEAETIVNGQKFKYICRYQHIGASTAQPGTFDHPDKCAELIVGEPGTVVSWTSKGKCYKAAGPGTKENTRTKVLAMEKVDDDDDLIVDPDDDLKTCNDKLKKAEEDLEKCENESKPPTTPPTTPPSTSPTCGKKHDQGGKEWEVTCDEIHVGTMIKPVYTTANVEECIDKCVAAQKQGCRLVAKLPKPTNNCVLYSGSAVRVNKSSGAITAEMQ